MAGTPHNINIRVRLVGMDDVRREMQRLRQTFTAVGAGGQLVRAQRAGQSAQTAALANHLSNLTNGAIRGLVGWSAIGSMSYAAVREIMALVEKEASRGMEVANTMRGLAAPGMSVQGLINFTRRAGARYGFNPDESTEFVKRMGRNLGGNAATLLAPEAMRQTRMFGLTGQEGAQAFGLEARLGVNTPEGQRRFAAQLADAIKRGRMDGREGEMFESIQKATEAIATSAALSGGRVSAVQGGFAAMMGTFSGGAANAGIGGLTGSTAGNVLTGMQNFMTSMADMFNVPGLLQAAVTREARNKVPISQWQTYFSQGLFQTNEKTGEAAPVQGYQLLFDTLNKLMKENPMLGFSAASQVQGATAPEVLKYLDLYNKGGGAKAVKEEIERNAAAKKEQETKFIKEQTGVEEYQRQTAWNTANTAALVADAIPLLIRVADAEGTVIEELSKIVEHFGMAAGPVAQILRNPNLNKAEKAAAMTAIYGGVGVAEISRELVRFGKATIEATGILSPERAKDVEAASKNAEAFLTDLESKMPKLVDMYLRRNFGGDVLGPPSPAKRNTKPNLAPTSVGDDFKHTAYFPGGGGGAETISGRLYIVDAKGTREALLKGTKTYPEGSMLKHGGSEV